MTSETTINTIEITERGFALFQFIDRCGEKCSLQKSSAGDQDCVWLGCEAAKPRWMSDASEYPLPNDVMNNTRMHLTKDMVRELLPMLQKFAETGDIVDYDTLSE